jgi:hypothetical protein
MDKPESKKMRLPAEENTMPIIREQLEKGVSSNRPYFPDLVLSQVKLQGGEPGNGGHPDPVIRHFYKATANILEGEDNNLYVGLINDVHKKRPDMDETHLVNIWFRAIQFVLRERAEKEYLNYSDSDWERYLKTGGAKDVEKVKELMLTNNTATHVLERYFSLATLMRLLGAKNQMTELKIVDVGCSLGLGLKACFANRFLCQSPLVDNTPGNQVVNALDLAIPKSSAIGVDIKKPSLEWVKACNYPSRYDTDGQKLENAAAILKEIDVPILEMDVLGSEFPKKIIEKYGKQNIFHSSMAMYELSNEEQKKALLNIDKCLNVGGFFVEFTFINPKDWFEGIHTTVMVKGRSGLSEPLEWHVWDNSRCTRVGTGKDYEKVKQLIC